MILRNVAKAVHTLHTVPIWVGESQKQQHFGVLAGNMCVFFQAVALVCQSGILRNQREEFLFFFSQESSWGRTFARLGWKMSIMSVDVDQRAWIQFHHVISHEKWHRRLSSLAKMDSVRTFVLSYNSPFLSSAFPASRSSRFLHWPDEEEMTIEKELESMRFTFKWHKSLLKLASEKKKERELCHFKDIVSIVICEKCQNWNCIFLYWYLF